MFYIILKFYHFSLVNHVDYFCHWNHSNYINFMQGIMDNKKKAYCTLFNAPLRAVALWKYSSWKKEHFVTWCRACEPYFKAVLCSGLLYRLLELCATKLLCHKADNFKLFFRFLGVRIWTKGRAKNGLIKTMQFGVGIVWPAVIVLQILKFNRSVGSVVLYHYQN